MLLSTQGSPHILVLPNILLPSRPQGFFPSPNDGAGEPHVPEGRMGGSWSFLGLGVTAHSPNPRPHRDQDLERNATGALSHSRWVILDPPFQLPETQSSPYKMGVPCPYRN